MSASKYKKHTAETCQYPKNSLPIPKILDYREEDLDYKPQPELHTKDTAEHLTPFNASLKQNTASISTLIFLVSKWSCIHVWPWVTLVQQLAIDLTWALQIVSCLGASAKSSMH